MLAICSMLGGVVCSHHLQLVAMIVIAHSLSLASSSWFCVWCVPFLIDFSAGETPNYDLMYYLKGAAAGGICCSITHGALTPVDVVKVK